MRLRKQVPDIDFEALRQGQRRALAKAITLIESTNPAHRREAAALLEQCLPHAGNSLRIGISGVPGVGKSTFIEAFGLFLISLGKRVGVLAVDPSSPLHGGSILGDKTRMEYLSREDNAFIRPSPAGRSLGGVANRTREAILVETKRAVKDRNNVTKSPIRPGTTFEKSALQKNFNFCDV